jgi:hypothetical protein
MVNGFLQKATDGRTSAALPPGRGDNSGAFAVILRWQWYTLL